MPDKNTADALSGPRLPAWAKACCWLLTLLAIAAAGTRAFTWRHSQGELLHPHVGFYDFNHGLYFPAQALLNGDSPYGKTIVDKYPMDTPPAPFGPAVFVLHAPLALLPQPAAHVACFALVCVLLILTARAAATAAGTPDAVALVACLLALSRSGHSTLLTGYFTLEVVLGVILALEHAGRRPWLSAAGLLLASFKANYAIPLIIVMLARGNGRAVTRGLALSLLFNGLPLLWLASRVGPIGLVEDFHAWEASPKQIANMTSAVQWTMIDLGSGVSKWTVAEPGLLTKLGVMAALLAPVCVLVAKRKRLDPQGAVSPSGMLACLVILVAIHHQFYDLPLLAAPVLGALLARPAGMWGGFSSGTRWVVAFLAAAPAYNPLCTATVLNRLALRPGDWAYRLFTSMNSFSLAAALLILAVAVFANRPTAANEAASEKQG